MRIKLYTKGEYHKMITVAEYGDTGSNATLIQLIGRAVTDNRIKEPGPVLVQTSSGLYLYEVYERHPPLAVR